MVVTTERVSPDAKRVLDEMAEQAKKGERDRIWIVGDQPQTTPRPILIEGLEKAKDELATVLDEAAVKAAKRRLKALDGATGFPVAAAVQDRLHQPDLT